MTTSNVTFGVDADARKAIGKLNKVVARLEVANQKLRGMNRAGDRASKSVGGIGKSAVTAAASMFGLHAAVAKVNQALEKQTQLRRDVAGRMESKEEALKRLIQISDTPEDFQRFQAMAGKLTKQQGMGYVEALNAVFAGTSLGFSEQQVLKMGDYKRFSKNLLPIFEAVAGIQAAFGPQALGGTSQSTVNALLAGAKESKVDIETLAKNVLAPAQSVKMLGGTAEEAVAALAVMAEALKSPEEAATALGRFSDIARKDKRAGLKGKRLEEVIDIVAGWDERRQERVFGKAIRAEKGMGVILQNREQIRAVLAEVVGAVAATGPGDLVTRKIAMGRGGPVADITDYQKAREGRKLTEDKELGEEALLRLQAREVYMEELAARRYGPGRRFGTDFRFLLDELFPVSSAIRGQRQALEQMGPLSPAAEAAYERLDAAAQKLEAAAERLQPAPVGVSPHPDR